MGRSIKILSLLCGAFLFWALPAMEPEKIVLVNPNAVVKQNIDNATMMVDGRRIFSKQEVLADTLHYPTFSTACLWAMSMASFGCVVYNQLSARRGFFKFLNKVPVAEQYPVVLFEGDRLPPIMTAWGFGLRSAEVIAMINNFITAQKYCGEVDRFLRAIVYTTFDPVVMEKTCYVDTGVVSVVEEFRIRGAHIFLVGDCNPEIYGRLQVRLAGLLRNVDRVLFTCQVADITKETQFTPEWWLIHIHSDQSPFLYEFIDDTDSPKDLKKKLTHWQ